MGLVNLMVKCRRTPDRVETDPIRLSEEIHVRAAEAMALRDSVDRFPFKAEVHFNVVESVV